MSRKYSKYLPSKGFMVIVGICLVLIAGIFLLFGKSKKGKFVASDAQTNQAVKIGNLTVTDLVQLDSDTDGIPDWEEALWGTDKNKKVTFDNTPDAEYIATKKEELKMPAEETQSSANPTETEKFAHEFFSAFTAMKQSGEVDQNAINNFSSALGQKAIDPNLIDRYSEKDIRVSQNETAQTRDSYFTAVEQYFDKERAAGVGDELDIVSGVLASYSATGKSVGVDKLLKIADAYQDFGAKMMSLSVPASLSQNHLAVANSANNTGIAVRNMMKIVDDPVVGLAGLSQYQKYSEDFIKVAGDLEAPLTSNNNLDNNDIIDSANINESPQIQ